LYFFLNQNDENEQEKNMRELTISEMVLVGGGLSEADTLAIVGALGAGVGMSLAQWAELTTAQQMAAAGYFGVGASAVTAAGLAGWAVGEWLNQHTPIQNVLSALLGGADADGG
jgi:hypothetical protein